MLQPLTVEFPRRRKLIQHGTEVLAERVHPAEQAIERLLGILQLLHVRQEPAGLHAVKETAWRARRPRDERAALRKSIKSIVDFNRVEDLSVMVEPSRPCDGGGI